MKHLSLRLPQFCVHFISGHLNWSGVCNQKWANKYDNRFHETERKKNTVASQENVISRAKKQTRTLMTLKDNCNGRNHCNI